jgi:hypothetical protein
MQGKLVKLFLFASTVLTLATVEPLWGQQPAGLATRPHDQFAIGSSAHH